jgi:hypothetical protein
MKTRLHAPINLLLIVMLVLSWAVPSTAATVAFFRHEATNHQDQTTLEPLCKELGFSVAIWTAPFVNDETNWFDEKGHRKLDIFIVPGGDSYKWFEKKVDGSLGIGINKKGCENIIRFMEQGGSCIGICYVGPELFAQTAIWKGLTGGMVERGKKWPKWWQLPTSTHPGAMLRRVISLIRESAFYPSS